MTLLAGQRGRELNGDDPAAGATSVVPLARRLHFYAGLFVAPLVMVLCLTGLAFACSPTLDNVIYAGEFFVGHPHPSAPLPLTAQVAAVRRAHPEGTLVAVQPPGSPSRTTGVDLAVAGLPAGSVRTVYVDPYTAQVRGALTMTNGRPPLQQWLWVLHGQLHAGTVGRWYSETAASWMPVLLAGGLVLWTQRRRHGAGRGPGARTRLRDMRGRARTRLVHTTLGLSLLLGLAAITVTGLTWSHYAGAHFETVLDALHGHTPTLQAPAEPAATSGPRLSVDDIARIGLANGLHPTTITYPTTPNGGFLVAENRDQWPIRRSALAVSPHSGAVTARLDFADYPPLAKLSTIGIRLHEGLLFGLANQIGMAALAIGTLILTGAGYRMWWRRRPIGTRRFARPPPRGAWRQLPTNAMIIGIPVILALGWLLPLFAITLAGFWLGDLACGHLGRRTHPRERAEP